ncbi:MAG TPA: hypothetical protein VIF14_07015 [Alphaproteobacteria bacterium]
MGRRFRRAGPRRPGQKPGGDFVGLGWFRNGKDDAFRFGHQGSHEGFQAELKLFPAQGAGAAVLINSIQGWPLCTEILKALGREFAWPAWREAPAAVALPARLHYAGRYRSDDGREAEVTAAAAGLTLRFAGQAPLALAAISETEFFAPALNLRVQFEVGEGPAPTALALIQGGKPLRLRRA